MSFENNPAKIRSVTDAKDLIARPDAVTVSSNLDFYYGDHFQSGAGWSGPIPVQTDEDYQTVYNEIERGFVSKNSIKEIVDRAVNGILGRDPQFAITFPDSRGRNQTKKAEEADKLVRQWMKDKNFKKYIAKATRNALCSGKSVLRLFVPPGMMKEDGTVAVNPKNPLSFLQLDAPHPLTAGIVTDESTRESTAIFVGSTIDEEGKEREYAEIQYLLDEENDEGKRLTELVILADRSDEPTEVQMDLGGKFMMFELEFPRLVTNQIRSLQMMQNLNQTMMQRNSVLGGFLERVILNGQLPGHYEDDGNGNMTFVRDEHVIGAGTVNAINGTPTYDEQGNVKSYTSASISYRDPVSVKTFLEASDSAYRSMLQDSQQLHALLSGDAITSGDSRRQALSSFMSSLRLPKSVVESAIEWVIETVLMVLGDLTEEPDRFRGIQVKAECKLDFGIIPASEVDLLERQVRIGIISVETARERIGIENLEEEAQRVRDGLDVVMKAAQLFASNASLDNGTDNRDKLKTTGE